MLAVCCTTVPIEIGLVGFIIVSQLMHRVFFPTSICVAGLATGCSPFPSQGTKSRNLRRLYANDLNNSAWSKPAGTSNRLSSMKLP